MTRFFLLSASLLICGCTPKASDISELSSQLVQDVEGYAIAGCLSKQSHAYLKDQGDAWASVIVQRMRGDVEVLADLAEAITRETAKAEMPLMRNEVGPEKDKPLPLLYCGEITAKPAVRAAIKKVIAKLSPAYEK